MARRLLAGTAAVLLYLAVSQAIGNPTYYSHSWIQVTNISGNVTGLPDASPLPGLDVWAIVAQPHDTASNEEQLWQVYNLTNTGSEQVNITIQFQYGHQFEIAEGDYASATSSLMAFVMPADQGSSGSFFAGAWQYEPWPEFSWEDGPSGSLTITGPRTARCLILGLGAWAYYDPPCGVPGPAAFGLCLVGAAIVGPIRARLKRPVKRTPLRV